MRLGDLDALFCQFWGKADPFKEQTLVRPCVVWSDAATMAREAPTIDPETLQIVRQLREENKNLKQAFGDTFACDLMDKLRKAENELARVTAERDALKINPPVEIKADAFALAVELARVAAEKEAAVKELNGIASLVDDLADFVDREIYPVVNYNLYLDLRENVDAVSIFQHEDKWRGPQKEE